MFENKKKPATEFKAGCGRCATDKELRALAKRFEEVTHPDLEAAYIAGFLAAFQFCNITEGADVYGWDALDYEENSFNWFMDDMIKDELRKVNVFLAEILGDDDGE